MLDVIQSMIKWEYEIKCQQFDKEQWRSNLEYDNWYDLLIIIEIERQSIILIDG